MSKDWTSISLTQPQKQVLQDYKPDGMAMGVWLVKTVQDAENTAQTECEAINPDMVREIVRDETRKALRDTLQ